MHNINEQDGKFSIAYAGKTPWHKHGQQISEAFDAATALREGGLDFKVGIQPLFLADEREVTAGKATVREDNGKVLGVVGNRYAVCQNEEAFGFFDGVFGKDKARYEVAGALGDGERVWMLAKLPGEFEVVGQDVVNQYLLLTNSHDGSAPVTARFTPIRVVCQNTLNAALSRKASNEIRIVHTGRVANRLEIAGKLLAQAGVFFNEACDSFRAFAQYQVKAAALTEYVTRAVTDEVALPLEKVSTRSRNVIERVLELHETGLGQEIAGVRGTLWGAYNALTEYVDHDKTESGLDYMLGSGARMKQRAFTIALEMAGGKN